MGLYPKVYFKKTWELVQHFYSTGDFNIASVNFVRHIFIVSSGST